MVGKFDRKVVNLYPKNLFMENRQYTLIIKKKLNIARLS